MLSLPGVFTGQHHFKLHERKSGTTFEQSGRLLRPPSNRTLLDGIGYVQKY